MPNQTPSPSSPLLARSPETSCSVSLMVACQAQMPPASQPWYQLLCQDGKPSLCPALLTFPHPMGRLPLGHFFPGAHVPATSLSQGALASRGLLVYTRSSSRPGKSGAQVLGGQLLVVCRLMVVTVSTQPAPASLVIQQNGLRTRCVSGVALGQGHSGSKTNMNSAQRSAAFTRHH